MKQLYKYILGGITILSFAQCGSSQKFVSQEEVPFQFGEVLVENWTIENSSDTGVNVFFPVENKVDTAIDSVHFRGQVVKPERIKRGTYLVYIARFRNKKSPGDIIMHADPSKEAANAPPIIIKQSPFELDTDEVVISYVQEGETKYYKISGIKETTPVVYPHKSKN